MNKQFKFNEYTKLYENGLILVDPKTEEVLATYLKKRNNFFAIGTDVFFISSAFKDDINLPQKGAIGKIISTGSIGKGDCFSVDFVDYNDIKENFPIAYLNSVSHHRKRVDIFISRLDKSELVHYPWMDNVPYRVTFEHPEFGDKIVNISLAQILPLIGLGIECKLGKLLLGQKTSLKKSNIILDSDNVSPESHGSIIPFGEKGDISLEQIIKKMLEY